MKNPPYRVDLPWFFLILAIIFFTISPRGLLNAQEMDFVPLEESASQSEDGSDQGSFESLDEQDRNAEKQEKIPIYYGGFIRQLFSNMRINHYYRKRNEIVSETRARGEIGYESGPFELYLAANADVQFTNRPNSPVYPYFWKSRIRNRAFSMEYEHDYTDYLVKADVHRLTFAYRDGPVNIVIGRQAISWGEGRFFNPMDLVTPLGIFLLDVEDVPGADAVNAQYYFNSYNSIQLVVAPYRRMDEPNLGLLNSEDANALIRFKGTYKNLDYVFVGGRHFRSDVGGFELSYSKYGAVWKFSYLGRKDDEDFYKDYLAQRMSHQIVAGVSYAFEGKIRTSAEFFVNTGHHDNDHVLMTSYQNEAEVAVGYENPRYPDSDFFRTNGRIMTRNPYFLQTSVGGEVIPLVNMDVFAIWDIRGKSVVYGPSVSYSFSDEGTAMVGARLFGYGDDNSRAEFGGMQSQVFGLIRYHF